MDKSVDLLSKIPEVNILVPHLDQANIDKSLDEDLFDLKDGRNILDRTQTSKIDKDFDDFDKFDDFDDVDDLETKNTPDKWTKDEIISIAGKGFLIVAREDLFQESGLQFLVRKCQG